MFRFLCIFVLFQLHLHCFEAVFQRIPTDTKTPVKLLYNNFNYSSWNDNLQQLYACPNGVKIPDEVQCDQEFKPTVTNEGGKCQNQNENYYSVHYDILAPDVRNNKMESYRADVYAFCFDEVERRSTGTWHTITSTEWIDYEETYKIHTMIQTDKIGGFWQDLSPLKRTFDWFCGDESEEVAKSSSHDYIIPELLVPSSDLDPLQSRGIDLHFFNVAAMWKQKLPLWNKLNKDVWKLVKKRKLFPNIITMTTQLYDYDHGEWGVGIKVPKWWYKRVINSNFEIYDIYLYNMKHEDGETFNYFCQDSVCGETGISPDGNGYIHCCKVQNPHNFP